MALQIVKLAEVTPIPSKRRESGRWVKLGVEAAVKALEAGDAIVIDQLVQEEDLAGYDGDGKIAQFRKILGSKRANLKVFLKERNLLDGLQVGLCDQGLVISRSPAGDEDEDEDEDETPGPKTRRR